jgi:carbonic anhydrase
MAYPGEIHFVYNNSFTNQTAVLGIFMQNLFLTNQTQNNTPRFYDVDTRNEWQRYFNIAQTLDFENNSTIINLNLALLMGESLQDFWRYQGSLTTPPCTENVIWTIFKEPIVFIESEFISFRQNIYFEDYRRSQPLYTRIIYRNFLNETFSSVPDYNCCPRSTLNQSSTSYRLTYFSLLPIFSLFFLYEYLF